MFDVAVLGAGRRRHDVCRGRRATRGFLRVVLVDHAERLAEKIRISGGGRCNFTNLGAGPANFLSDNPHFCRSALSGYTPQDFLALLKRHRIAWHEKHRGQLFCDDSSESIIEMLRAECACRRRSGAWAARWPRWPMARPASNCAPARAQSAPPSWRWPPAAWRSRNWAPPTSA